MNAHAPVFVLDTNVALDWLLFADPRCADLGVAVAAGHLRWVASARMRDEFADVVTRGLAARRGVEATGLIAVWDRYATLVDPPPAQPLVCTDPDDQVFIDLAVEQCAVLLTRDKALLRLARRALPLGVRIVVPARWRA